MNNHQKKFNEEQIRFYAGCALSSLEYLYNNNIIHLDIKPENFICDDKGYFHLSDFGNARKTKVDDPKIKLNEVIGTPHYISPEMIIGDNVSYVSDYFCLGIILYELITGTTPIKGTYNIEMKNEVDRLNINLSPKECGYSFELCDLVNKLLKKNSAERRNS
jgi:serum/glucocorticoid-regulated kinase 2